MSTPVKEQYIIDREGHKTAVIISIEQYEQMLEDLHDLAIVVERRSEQPVSLATMHEWLKEDGISSC
jgi:PHD/YefM family antitoxin component YafN of YafNO toxin-antitoxin module